jgi:acyl-CoA synthetase (AMP-forming)/AMP-acid ligase II/acyl dehydratase
MTADELLNLPFATIADAIAAHAGERPRATALVLNDQRMDFATLNDQMDRVSAALQRDGLVAGSVVAVCAHSSIDYAVLLLGATRVGIVVAPLATGATPETLVAMIADADAKLLFVDSSSAGWLLPVAQSISASWIRMGRLRQAGSFEEWLAPPGARPDPVAVRPEWAFNIIYSSGTTGIPKGIVQSHALRWGSLRQTRDRGFGPDMVTLASTPLYSNTTLISTLPALARGGRVVLMDKFDATAFLALAQRERATYAIMVPVQFQRILASPDFDNYDLSSFRAKSCAGAPCSIELKREILARWPGQFFDVYGMTEGGAVCMLAAHDRPDKLHTVGKPLPGHEMLIIGEDDRPVEAGKSGEIVGRSYNMMTCYHRQTAKTQEAEWFSADGQRYLRTGDIGYFDEDGYLVLIDRKKDMIISGGFNLYPSDLEVVLRTHPDVAEAAVVGVPSVQWGESPVAFIVLEKGRTVSVPSLKDWANLKLGKTQRLTDVHVIRELPRSAVGKLLKRELRDRYLQFLDLAVAPMLSAEGEILAVDRKSAERRDVTILNKVDKSYVGHVRPPSTVKVEAAQCRAFVNAIGETNPIYRDVDAARKAGFRGLPIPPTYLFCLQMMSSEEAYAAYQELGIDVGRLLHGEQGFKYHLPVHVGDELTFHHRILDVQDKKDGAMTLIVQGIRVENGEGHHVADLHQTTVVRN